MHERWTSHYIDKLARSAEDEVEVGGQLTCHHFYRGCIMIRKTIAGIAFLSIISGCGSTYYRISVPGTEKYYYTTGYQDLGYGQGIRFNDLRTGDQVTMPASDIHPIKREELPPDLKGK